MNAASAGTRWRTPNWFGAPMRRLPSISTAETLASLRARSRSASTVRMRA